MRILIVSAYFPPFNAIGAVRLGKLAKFFVENGHDVKVISAYDETLEMTLAVEIDQRNIYTEKWIDIHAIPRWILKREVVQKKSAESSNANKIITWAYDFFRSICHWPDRHIGWYFPAKKAGQKIIRDWKPDLIYASAWPITSLLVAKTLSNQFAIPWVGELRDLWLDNHYYKVPKWRRYIDSIVENRLLRSAELLVTVSEPLADTLCKKFFRPTAVVLNGFDPGDFTNPGVGSLDDCLVITYTGMIYPGRRDPTPLFEALKILGSNASNIKIKFYGRLLSGLQAIVDKHGVSDYVELNPPVPYSDALKIQQESDILLLLLWDCPEEKGVFTGKLFEYIGAQRPILCCGMEYGVAASLITERKVGLVSNNPNDIAEMLTKWLNIKRTTGKVPAISSSVTLGLSRYDQFDKLLPLLVKAASKSVPRKSVLVVTKGMEVGGTERHLLRVLPRLVDDFDIKLLLLQSGGFLESEIRSTGVVVLAPPRILGRFLGSIWFVLSLVVEMLCARNCSVHFFLPEAYLIGGLTGVITRHKDMLMSRRSLNLYQLRHPFIAKVEHWLHRKMKMVLGNSNAVINDLISEGVAKDKIALTYNGLDIREFANHNKGESSRSAYGINPSDIVIAVVANLIHYKGHIDLIHAMGIVSKSIPDGWKLLIVGRDDGMGDAILNTAVSEGIFENLVVVGQVENVQPIWAISDLGVLPSHQEGFSNSLIEGMAMGLAMVATDVGGNSEAIVNGESGIIIPAQNPDAMATAISYLIENPDVRIQMGVNAKKRVLERFSLDALVDKYKLIYSKSYGLTDRETGDI